MSDFKKRHAAARKIQAKHPGKKYATCFKEAGKTVGAKKKRKVGARKVARKKTARKKVGAKYKVYHEVKRVGAVKYKGGSLSLGSIASTTSHLNRQLDDKLSRELLAKEKASTKTAKKKAQKKINATRAQVKAIGSLRRK
jgi:hypothetical protein